MTCKVRALLQQIASSLDIAEMKTIAMLDAIAIWKECVDDAHLLHHIQQTLVDS